MIEKKIHYCWFGGNEKDELIQKCIDTWKLHLPEYEILEWNEQRINLESMPRYVRQAYQQKKWAFVSDYVRLYALYHDGGIYLDTDVEVLRTLNPLLDIEGFCGFQHKYGLVTAICGAVKQNKLIKEMMEYYESREFIRSDGNLDIIANPIIWAEIFKKHGMLMEDKTQVLDNDFIIYNSNYFGNNKKTSYMIHHFQGTWVDEAKYISNIRKILQKILGKRRYNKFASAVMKMFQ